MFVDIPENGYHISKHGIQTVESKYGAKYMGYWAIRRNDVGEWIDTPVDVFYQPNPDVSKKHSNYFGIYVSSDKDVMICDAKSAFSVPMIGVVIPSGEVLISRYRQNCVVKDGVLIDGGRDYLRRSGSGQEIVVTVKSGQFLFELPETSKE